MEWDGSIKNDSRVSIDCKIPLRPLVPKSMSKGDTSATYLTRDSDLWILRLSATKCQRDADKEHSTTSLICDTKSSSLRVSPQEMVSMRPLATAKLTMND